MYTETLTQRQGISNGVVPQSLNNGRLNSGAVDMQKFRRALFTLYIGANSGSINCYLQEDDNTSFTNASNDTAGSFSGSGGSNTSVTARTAASQIVTFEVKDIDLTAGKRYVRLQIKETNVGAVLVCVTAIGDEAENKPGSDQNGTHVASTGTQKVVA